MFTILIVGKEKLRSAKIPQYSRHRLISGSNQHTLLVRLSFNRYLGLSRKGIAPLGNLSEPYDIVHSVNDIPLTKKPWIVTFEDLLPRTFGLGGDRVMKLIRPRMLARNCLRLVGQSKYAIKRLSMWNNGWKGAPRLLEKAAVIYPSIDIQPHRPKAYGGDSINMIFCGRDFARKGGVSAVRLAKLAHDQGLPLKMHIVSDLRLGQYTDHTDAKRYKADLELLDLPNIVYHKGLENHKILGLLQKCEFQYLPTIGDTFGFSVVEGLSVGTPAIVSNTCAMPELVQHGKSGYLLDVDVNEVNDISWLRPTSNAADVAYRGTDMYWEYLDHTYTSFALQTLEVLEGLIENPNTYESLSAGALARAASQHDARKMSQKYDQLYDEAMR